MEVEAQGGSSTAASSSGDVKSDEKSTGKSAKNKASGPLFSLKKWNAVAMWQWDVECDTCAICRVQVMGRLGGCKVMGRSLEGGSRGW